MTRYIVGKNESYPTRCEILKIPLLSCRHEIMDPTFLYKYLHGNLNVCFNDEFRMVEINTGLQSSNCLTTLPDKLVKTETFQSSFFNRIVRLWNNLPVDLKNCDNFFQVQS